MAIPARLQDFLDNLAMFPDRADRIQILIETAKRFEPVASDVAERPFDERHRVPGCESEAFVWVNRDEAGRVRLDYAVENPQGISAMALATILKENLDGSTVAEVQAVPDDIVTTIFGRELSMGKNLGLVGVLQATKAFARMLD